MRENEALISQDIAVSDVKAILDNEKTCYIQKLKKNIETLEKQVDNKEQDAKEIVESTKELSKNCSLKEYLDYFFN